MTLNSEGLEKTWRFDIQHGPDGEANYAWVYNGKDLVATMRTHHAVSIVEAMNRRALSPVDGLEVVMEKICHKEQIGIWANEITSALALSDFLREEWTFDDSVDLEREIAAQVLDIVKAAFTHPGLDLVASLSQASSVIAGLKAERDHWKANHDQMVQRNSVLRERPDLPADRLPAIARYEAEIERLTTQLAETSRTALSIDGEAQEMSARISSLEEQNKRLKEALSRAERSFNNIRGAIESNQVIDKDAHGTAIRALVAARQALGDHNG